MSTTSRSRCTAIMTPPPLSFRSLRMVPEYASRRNSLDLMSSVNLVSVISMTSGFTYSARYSNWARLFRALLQFMTQTLKLSRFLWGRLEYLWLLLPDDLGWSPLEVLELLCLSGARGDESDTVDRSNTESSPGMVDTTTRRVVAIGSHTRKIGM